MNVAAQEWDYSTVRWGDMSDFEQKALLRRPAVQSNAAIAAQASKIIDSVRKNGDKSLRDLARKYEGATLTALQVTAAEFEKAEASLPAGSLAAIDQAIANIQRFHEEQLPVAIDMETVAGVRCERVSHPIESVGLYVPAGTAPLPSAAMMLAVPAVIAGCQQIVLCSPARADGSVDPSILVAARRAGVSQVFKVGGAQAIAAMAYGSESIPKVEKIFGPGNAWVTAAKTLIAADPEGAAIDMPAGPSEVLVIADANANPEFIAADLLSQAEHGADSQVVFLCTDAGTLQRTITAVKRQLPRLSRSDTAAAALRNSRFVLAGSLAEAARISNEYAPEHLIIQCENARALLRDIRNAGSVFLGAWSPEAVGDYCSGTNHVLPTYGAAKRFSGLGVEHFIRYMTVQELSKAGLQALAPCVLELARMEGLDAHANAVKERLKESTPV